MTDAFDPYLSWLGIRTAARPPDHYRLLGLEHFESDADVIANAADRQMAHVRTYQSGKHGAISQRILNELASARLCLLDPQRKSQYDQRLKDAKQKAAARKAAAAPVQAVAVQAIPVAAAVVPMHVEHEAESQIEFSPKSGRKRAAKTKKSAAPFAFVGVAALAVVVAVVAWQLKTKRGADGQQVANAGEPVSPGAKQTDDGATVTGGERPSPAHLAPAESGVRQQPKANEATTGKKPSDDLDAKASIAQFSDNQDSPRQSRAPETETSKPEPEQSADATATASTGGNSDSGDATKPADETPTEKPVTGDTGTSGKGPVDGRLPVPSTDSQKAALKKIKTIFDKEFVAANNAERRSTLAETLLKQGQETVDDDASRYILLQTAKDLAAKAGRSSLALQAVEETGRLYAIDTQQQKIDALTESAKSPRDAAAGIELLDNLNSLGRQAAATDHYDVAVRLAQLAASAASKTKNNDAMRAANARLKELQDQQKAFETAQKAAETLAANPDDAEANLVRGRYLCLVKEAWPEGLKHLLKSGDAALAAAAALDLTNPTEAAKQAEAGDAWWDLSFSAKGVTKELAHRRAPGWYQQALPQLTGLAKTRVEKRLNQINDEEQANVDTSAKLGGSITRLLSGGAWSITWANGVTYRGVKLAQDGRWSRDGDPTIANWTVSGRKVMVTFPSNDVSELYDFSAYQRNKSFTAKLFKNGEVQFSGTGIAE